MPLPAPFPKTHTHTQTHSHTDTQTHIYKIFNYRRRCATTNIEHANDCATGFSLQFIHNVRDAGLTKRTELTPRREFLQFHAGRLYDPDCTLLRMHCVVTWHGGKRVTRRRRLRLADDQRSRHLLAVRIANAANKLCDPDPAVGKHSEA